MTCSCLRSWAHSSAELQRQHKPRVQRSNCSRCSRHPPGAGLAACAASCRVSGCAHGAPAAGHPAAAVAAAAALGPACNRTPPQYLVTQSAAVQSISTSTLTATALCLCSNMRRYAGSINKPCSPLRHPDALAPLTLVVVARLVCRLPPLLVVIALPLVALLEDGNIRHGCQVSGFTHLCQRHS